MNGMVEWMRGAENYGSEAVSTILKHMSPPAGLRPTCVVVLAGYEKPMNNFLQMNAGLPRRIQQRLVFKPYSLVELREIFLRMLRDRRETLVADPDLKDEGADGVASALSGASIIVDSVMQMLTPQAIQKENAAIARRLYSEAESLRASRLSKHLAHVRLDPRLVDRFTRIDLIRAAEAVNRFYADSSTD